MTPLCRAHPISRMVDIPFRLIDFLLRAVREKGEAVKLKIVMAMEDSGLRDACGVFGCVAAESWPTDLDVSHVICLGLVGLQHR